MRLACCTLNYLVDAWCLLGGYLGICLISRLSCRQANAWWKAVMTGIHHAYACGRASRCPAGICLVDTCRDPPDPRPGRSRVIIPGNRVIIPPGICSCKNLPLSIYRYKSDLSICDNSSLRHLFFATCGFSTQMFIKHQAYAWRLHGVCLTSG